MTLLPYPTECVAEGCAAPVRSRGLCGKHHHHLQRGRLRADIIPLPADPWDVYERPARRTNPVVVDWSGITAVVACSECRNNLGPYWNTQDAYAAAVEHARGGNSPHADQAALPWPSRSGLDLSDDFRPQPSVKVGAIHGEPLVKTVHKPSESLSALVGHVKNPLGLELASFTSPASSRPRKTKIKPTAEDRAWQRRIERGERNEAVRSPLTPEVEAAIVEALRSGASVKSLVDLYRVSQNRVRLIRAASGIPARKVGGVSLVSDEEILAALKAGEGTTATAKRLHVTPTRVSRLRVEHGIAPLRGGRPPKRNPIDETEALTLLRSGMSCDRVAALFHVDPKRVRKIRDDAGIRLSRGHKPGPLPGFKRKPEAIDAVVSSYRNGESIAAIARTRGVATSSVRRMLKRWAPELLAQRAARGKS